MKKFCVIGKDIGYSLSPTVHRKIYEALDLDAEYRIEDIAELTKEKVKELLSKYDGFNVTKPYKKLIGKYIDNNLSDFESINTVVNFGGKSIGFNTDYYGFRMDFGNKCRGNLKKTALVYGSGGAAETVVPALKAMGFKVRIVSRNLQTKAELEELFAIEKKQRFSPAVIINCTPADIPIEEKTPEFIYELRYNDGNTALICAKRGIRYSNGLGMLVYQAIAADEIFFGLSLSETNKKNLAEKILQDLY